MGLSRSGPLKTEKRRLRAGFSVLTALFEFEGAFGLHIFFARLISEDLLSKFIARSFQLRSSSYSKSDFVPHRIDTFPSESDSETVRKVFKFWGS